MQFSIRCSANVGYTGYFAQVNFARISNGSAVITQSFGQLGAAKGVSPARVLKLPYNGKLQKLICCQDRY